MMHLPHELTNLKQFVCWRFEPKPDAKPDKVPYNPKPYRASHSAARTWSTYHDVMQAWQARPDFFTGIGFVFSTKDPYTGIDFDDCLDEHGAFIDPWAEAWVRRLNSFTEISPSGRGVKVWVRGKVPAAVKIRAKIEIYDRLRFFTITGRLLPGSPTTIRDAQADLDALYAEVRPNPTPCADVVTTSINDDEVERELKHVARLLDGDGIPRRLTARAQTRGVLVQALAGWPGGTPDYSLERAKVVYGLVKHGYPDTEIAALLWHYRPVLNGGGKSIANWAADITRLISKARTANPNVTVTPSGYVVTTSKKPTIDPKDCPTPPSRARKDRPQKVAGAQGYLVWLRSQADQESGMLMLSANECAERLGCSLRTIRRYERELSGKDEKHPGPQLIERRAYAQRQAGCLFVQLADQRGDNIPESATKNTPRDVVTDDRGLAQPDAENSDVAPMQEETHLAFGPTTAPHGQTTTCVPPPPRPIGEVVYAALRACEADERINTQTGEIRPGRVSFKKVAALVRETHKVGDTLLRRLYDRQLDRRQVERETERLPHKLDKRFKALVGRIDRILANGKTDPSYWWAWHMYDAVSAEQERRSALRTGLSANHRKRQLAKADQDELWDALELAGLNPIVRPIRRTTTQAPPLAMAAAV